jgi:hypothetical protein
MHGRNVTIRQLKNPQSVEASQIARHGHMRVPPQPANPRARSGSWSRKARGSVERSPHTDEAWQGRRFVELHQWLVATHHKNMGDSHRCSSPTHHRATHWSWAGLPHSSTSVRCGGTAVALRGATRAEWWAGGTAKCCKISGSSPCIVQYGLRLLSMSRSTCNMYSNT